MTIPLWAFALPDGYLHLANFLVNAGANLFIQSAILIAVGLVLTRFLRRRGSAVQSVVLRGVLVALILSPILSLILSKMGLSIVSLPLPRAEWSATVEPGVIEEASVGRPEDILSRTTISGLTNALSEEAATGTSARVRSLPPLEAVASADVSRGFTPLAWAYFVFSGLWIAGASGLLGWLAICHIMMAKLRRRARSAPEECLRTCQSLANLLEVKCPKVVRSQEVKSPLLTGLFSPVIIFPDVEEVEETVASDAVFIHELAHLKRRDCLWNLIARTLSSLLFYQPLIRLLARKAEEVSDDVCDDYVIRYGCARKAYARQLTYLAQRFQPGLDEAAVGAGVVRFRSSLGRRVVRILDASRRLATATPRRTVYLAAFGVLIGAVLAGTLGFLPMASAPKPIAAAEEQEKPAASEAVSVKGRVVNEKGEPVKGAKVYSYLIVNYVQDEIEKEAVSGEDGSFSFKGLPRLKARYSSRRSVIATAEGYAIGGVGLYEKTDLSNIKITLFPPGSVSGKVTDKQRRPVQGAKVRAQTIADDADWSKALVGIHLWDKGADKFASAITDEGGNYTINNVPQGSQVGVSVFEENYGRIYGGGLLGQEDFNFTLAPAGIIEGKVTLRTTGKAVSGLMVLADPEDDFSAGGWTETDARGNFRITNLHPGAYDLEISFTEESPEWLGLGKSDIEVREGGITPGINLYLIKGGIITGKVVDKETQKPIKGVRLSCGSLDYHPATGGSAVTGEDGTYELRAVPGKVGIGLDLPEDYLSEDRKDPSRWMRRREVELKEEILTGVDFSLVKAVKIAGRVVDENGNAIPNASIRGTIWSMPLRGIARITAKEDGTFEIERLYPDVEVILLGRSEEPPLSGRAEVTAQRDKVSEVTVILRKGGAVKGRVVDEKGKPIPGAKVWASLHLFWPDRLNPVYVYHEVGRGATDASGNYLIEGLIRGQKYRTRTTAEGYGERTSELFTPETGKTTNVKDIVLLLAESFIAGRVTDFDTGKPIRQAMVHAWRLPDGAFSKYAYTDSEGKYRIVGLTKGWFELRADATEYETDSFTIDSGRDDVNFKLVEIGKEKPERDKSRTLEVPKTYKRLEIGDLAPLFETKTLDGEALKLEDYRGKFVLLDFWATWCGPCLAQTPHLKATYEAFGEDERFVMIGLSLDIDVEAAKKYVAENDLKWIQGFLGEWSKTSVPDEYGVRGIPAIFLIGPDGKVIAKGLRGAAIKQAVERALRKPVE